MNRFAAHGLHAAAAAGRRILVLTCDPSGVDEFAPIIDDRVKRVSRANGAERIEYLTGGVIHFRSYDKHGERGVSVDTVYIDAGVDERIAGDLARWSSIAACVATSPTGELVRA